MKILPPAKYHRTCMDTLLSGFAQLIYIKPVPLTTTMDTLLSGTEMWEDISILLDKII